MDWRIVEETPERKLTRFGETVPDMARHIGRFVPGDVWGIIAAVVALFMLGGNLVAGIIDLSDGAAEAIELSAGLMWANSILLLIGFGALPFMWIATTRVGGWQGTLAFFQLRRPWSDAAIGLGLAVGILIAMMIVNLIWLLFGEPPANPAIESLRDILSWPLIIAISLSAAVGEEVLFRGVVQRHIGMWPQALLFGSLHAYQGFYGVILTTALAVLFGYIVKRKWGLWIPIAAHFFFNAIQLAILMLAPADLTI